MQLIHIALTSAIGVMPTNAVFECDTANANGEGVKVARLMPPVVWDPHNLPWLLVADYTAWSQFSCNLTRWPFGHFLWRIARIWRVQDPTLAANNRSKPGRWVVLWRDTSTVVVANARLEGGHGFCVRRN